MTYAVANKENNVLTIDDPDYDWTWISITIPEGTTFDNVTYKPQLESGTTVTNYELYGASPSQEYPSEINSVGDLITDTADANYGKYKIPVKVTGKNLWTTNYSYPLYRFDKAAVEYDDKTQMYTINQSSGNISTSIYKIPKEIPTGTKITIYMYIIQG